MTGAPGTGAPVRASPTFKPSKASSGWPVSDSTSVRLCTARVIATYSALT